MNTKAKLSSVIPYVFTGIAVIVALISVWAGWQNGALIVLTLTLIAVIWYTYYTYQLAVKKEGAIVVGTIQYVPEARDVRVIISNPTIRYAAASVCVSVKVYGRETDLGTAYSGKTVWHLTPQFVVNGHFLLENPLNQVGKTFVQMVDEANDNNFTRQLQLSLKVSWEDETGKTGKQPEHWWYFDFRSNSFVYQVGGFPDS